MWPLLTPLRKRTEIRRTPVRRLRSYRPHCKFLEDRCLLSVTLSSSGPSVPLVGSPVLWTATASGDGSSPVYQFSVTPPGGTSQMVQDFSPANTFTWDPLQQGTFSIQVVVKSSYTATTTDSATASYTAQSRVVGNTAVISPTSNPLVALFSAPPSSGSFDVRPVQPTRSQPVLDQYRPAADCAGGEHQLPGGRHAARHDLPHEGRPERWDDLRPAAVHDRKPADERDFPHIHGSAGTCPRVLT